MFAEDEAALLTEAAAGDSRELDRLVAARTGGTPLQLVLGWAEFCGLRIAVAPGVFVPRHKTEFLAEKAIGFAEAGSLVLDLCCGSGAIGVALAAAVDGIELHASDLEPAAVACARENVGRVQGQVWEGDLYRPLPRALMGRFEVIVVNAPYVPSREVRLMPREARLYEEWIALDGGEDGLEIQRRAIKEAPQWLTEGGRILVETSDKQMAGTMEAMEDAGLKTTVALSSELEATVVIGRK